MARKKNTPAATLNRSRPSKLRSKKGRVSSATELATNPVLPIPDLSLIDTARNTDRRHAWDSALKLRDRPLKFTRAAFTEPDDRGRQTVGVAQCATDTGFNSPQPSFLSVSPSEQPETKSVGEALESPRQIDSQVNDTSSLPPGGHPFIEQEQNAQMAYIMNQSTDSDSEVVLFTGRNRKGDDRNTSRNRNAAIGETDITLDEFEARDRSRQVWENLTSTRRRLLKQGRGSSRTRTIQSLDFLNSDLSPSAELECYDHAAYSNGSMSDLDSATRDYMANLEAFETSDEDNSRIHAFNESLESSKKLDEARENFRAMHSLDASSPIDFKPDIGVDMSDHIFGSSGKLPDSKCNTTTDAVDQAVHDSQEVLFTIGNKASNITGKEADITDYELARRLGMHEAPSHDFRDSITPDLTQGERSFRDSEKENTRQSGFQDKETKARSQRKEQPKQKSQSPFSSMVGDEIYGNFDIMDRERPSIRQGLKINRPDAFPSVEDSELEESLILAWNMDRLGKRRRKKQREELRSQGVLNKNGNLDLRAKYAEGMNIEQIKLEIQNFLASGKSSLSLTPMDKGDRKIVHEFANAFNLTSKSVGSGSRRYPSLFRTSKTRTYDESHFRAVEARVTRRFLPRLDKTLRGGPRGNDRQRAREGGGGGGNGAATYRDGDIVGGTAPELGIENKGRAMLERMGWSTGTALGAMNNKGVLQPVPHVVKNTRAGLG